MFGLIVKKELREILATPRFAATFAVVSLLILLSFYLGAANYQSSREQYEAAVAEDLRQMEGQTDWLNIRPSIFLPPQPLAALVNGISNDVGRTIRVLGRGALRPEGSRYNEEPVLAMFRFLDLEFIFLVVLSLFAILFAFDLISGEKERGTLRLALSNAVPRDKWIFGKLVGAFLALVVPLLIPILLGCLLLIAMGVPLSGDEWLRLALVVAAGMLYVGTFLGLTVLVSALTHRSSTSFLIVLVLWIMAVMILPRSSVLLAARSVDVPSVDEMLSQQRRLRTQLWQEDRVAMQDYLQNTMNTSDADEESPAARQAMMNRFNSFMQEQGENRNARLNALTARLEEERANRQVVQQNLAFGISRLSPAAAFSLASMNLAGTAIDLPRHYIDQAKAYQEAFARFQKEKTGRSAGGMRIMIRTSDEEEEEEKAIDPRELPVFDFQPPGAGQILRGATLDLGILALMNVLFTTGAFVAFLRYDVR